MLITYCLTVRLLARQQQSLCGGGPVTGGVSTTNGNQPNGWGSGWLGQQNLGMCIFIKFTFVCRFYFSLSIWSFSRRKRVICKNVVPPEDKRKKNHLFLFVFNTEKISLHVYVHRTKVYMATPTKNQFTINAKSSPFSQFNRYRAFEFRYTRIMVTRFKVSLWFFPSLSLSRFPSSVSFSFSIAKSLQYSIFTQIF